MSFTITKVFIDFRSIDCLELLSGRSSKSSIARAMSYFVENYVELTRFLGNVRIPIDNNSQERLTGFTHDYLQPVHI